MRDETDDHDLAQTSRRSLVAALGALGGLGIGTLTGTPTTAEAASGTSGIAWADTIGTTTSPGDLRDMTGSQDPNGTQVIIVKGFWAAGDGGGGLFYWDLDIVTPDNGGTVVVPGATPRTGCWKRVVNDATNVRWFGAKGDGATDDLAAFEAAIRSLTPTAGVRGPLIVVPPGTYHMSATLRVDRQVTLSGATGSGRFGSSILQFPPGASGITVFRQTGSSPYRGDWSVIQNLSVVAQGRSTEAHGIVLQARALINQCYVKDFAGNGIHIDTRDAATNANNWMVQYTRIESCMHGLYAEGPNSNAGVCVGLDTSINRGWGIYDSSFLGNTFLACHAATNALGSYHTDNLNSASVFVGCYTEGDNPANFTGTTLVLGGVAAAGAVTPDSGGATLAATHNGLYAYFSRGVRGWDRRDTAHRAFGQLGIQNGTYPSAFGFGLDPHVSYRLVYNRNTARPYWFFHYANLDAGWTLGLGEGGGDSPNGRPPCLDAQRLLHLLGHDTRVHRCRSWPTHQRNLAQGRPHPQLHPCPRRHLKGICRLDMRAGKRRHPTRGHVATLRPNRVGDDSVSASGDALGAPTRYKTG